MTGPLLIWDGALGLGPYRVGETQDTSPLGPAETGG